MIATPGATIIQASLRKRAPVADISPSDGVGGRAEA
jgi:hypothetical protein